MAAHPLWAIEQQRQCLCCLAAAQPADGRDFPAAAFAVGAGLVGPFVDATGRIGSPEAARRGEVEFTAPELMQLTPVGADDQFQPGAIGLQAHRELNGAAAAGATPAQLTAERPVFDDLRFLLPTEIQRLLAVVAGQVPGVPELTAIREASPGQGFGQQFVSPAFLLRSLQLQHSCGTKAGTEMVVLQPPATPIAWPQLHRAAGPGGR